MRLQCWSFFIFAARPPDRSLHEPLARIDHRLSVLCRHHADRGMFFDLPESVAHAMEALGDRPEPASP
jgi:hypothetical protein